MRFRDPKTGKVFEDIDIATNRYCAGRRCFDCVFEPKGEHPCIGWPREYPREAAELMGFEIVEEEEANAE